MAVVLGKTGRVIVEIAGNVLALLATGLDGRMAAGTAATVAPIVIIPLGPGAALLRSARSWVLLVTDTAGAVGLAPNKPFVRMPVELRRLFTVVVATVSVFDVTGPIIGSVPVIPLTLAIGPPPRLALGRPSGPDVFAN
jgi:hypothetical protein